MKQKGKVKKGEKWTRLWIIESKREDRVKKGR
jgi:hypothetical protein